MTITSEKVHGDTLTLLGIMLRRLGGKLEISDAEFREMRDFGIKQTRDDTGHRKLLLLTDKGQKK